LPSEAFEGCAAGCSLLRGRGAHFAAAIKFPHQQLHHQHETTTQIQSGFLVFFQGTEVVTFSIAGWFM